MERRGAAPPCKCSGKTRDRAAQKSVGVVFCWVTEDEIKFDKNDPFGDTIGERMGKRGGEEEEEENVPPCPVRFSVMVSRQDALSLCSVVVGAMESTWSAKRYGERVVSADGRGGNARCALPCE